MMLRSAPSVTLSHLEIYFALSTIWLRAAEFYKETYVFPELNLLTNNSGLTLNMQITMPRVVKSATVSACRERQ